MSTSTSYLRKRLRDIGRLDLLEGAERGDFSFHAAAIDAGLIKQPAINGNGSQNASKRTAYALWKATRSSPLGGPMRSTLTMPNLEAALEEVQEMQRPAPPRDEETLHAREPAPAALPPAESVCSPFPAHPAVPCTSCSHPQAAAALREILDVFVAACRGKLHPTGSTFPRACCRRQPQGRPDARAMIA
jgi:hypothetical protein